MFGAVEEKVSADFPGSAAIKEFPDASEFVLCCVRFFCSIVKREMKAGERGLEDNFHRPCLEMQKGSCRFLWFSFSVGFNSTRNPSGSSATLRKHSPAERLGSFPRDYRNSYCQFIGLVYGLRQAGLRKGVMRCPKP